MLVDTASSPIGVLTPTPVLAIAAAEAGVQTSGRGEVQPLAEAEWGAAEAATPLGHQLAPATEGASAAPLWLAGVRLLSPTAVTLAAAGGAGSDDMVALRVQVDALQRTVSEMAARRGGTAVATAASQG
jgi:hypothetical protein